MLEQLAHPGSDPIDLAILATLRRLQGRPDPLRVEVIGRDELVVPWPGDAVIEARAVHADADGTALEVWTSLSPWHVHVVDTTGTPRPVGSRPQVDRRRRPA